MREVGFTRRENGVTVTISVAYGPEVLWRGAPDEVSLPEAVNIPGEFLDQVERQVQARLLEKLRECALETEIAIAEVSAGLVRATLGLNA